MRVLPVERPSDELHERARVHARGDGNGDRQCACIRREHGDAARDELCEQPRHQVEEHLTSSRALERTLEFAHVAHVREQLRDRRNAPSGNSRLVEVLLEQPEEAFGIAQQQVVRIPEVRVEGRASDLRLLDHALHRDAIELLGDHQLDEGDAERALGATHAQILARRPARCSLLSFRNSAGRFVRHRGPES